MCNLYSLTPKRDMVARFFRVSHNRTVAFEPVNAIFPRHVAPVVRQSADGEREIVTMSWGFMRLEKGRAPKPVTNVRDDQIQTNPFWRDSFRQRRCLVPASSFCEPNGDVKPATWNWFAINGGDDARPLFAFPGHLAPLQGPGEEGRPERRYRDLRLPDHHAEPAGRHHQPRAHAGAADARGGIRDLAQRARPMKPSRSRASIRPSRMRIVQEGLDKEDLLRAA